MPGALRDSSEGENLEETHMLTLDRTGCLDPKWKPTLCVREKKIILQSTWWPSLTMAP